jgi:hypothetical protein
MWAAKKQYSEISNHCSDLGFKTSEINDDPGFKIVSLALREKPL